MLIHIPNQWTLELIPTGDPESFKVNVLANGRIASFTHTNGTLKEMITIKVEINNIDKGSTDHVIGINTIDDDKILGFCRRHLNNRTRNRWST